MNEMNRDEPHGEVPPGEMEPDMPRFGPTDRAPGNLPPPSWEPGVVEVQLREDVQPNVIRTEEAGAPAEIGSAQGVNLTELNQILRQYQLQRAEATFQRSPGEASEAQAVARQQGVELPSLLNFVTLRFPADADTPRIAQELNQLPEVERAVPVPTAIPPQTPLNEPLVGTSDQVVVDPITNLENQWYVFRCRANQAWKMSSGNNVVIADIDWGYCTTHQDLASRLDLNRAYNSYDGGTDVSHGVWISHGTAVMGIAGGADNDLGIAGFAFKATLWPIQADSGPGVALGGDSWAGALDWVRTADSGGRRKVINLEVQTGSYGNYEQVPSVNTAIQYAIADGVVVCVAAGNGDRDAGVDDMGNSIPETGSILVGATAYDPAVNPRAGFSNYGPRIVVSAPGDTDHDLTCGSSSDSDYRNGFGGTSGATPKVAATAALMVAVNRDLTQAEIRTILHSTGSAIVTAVEKPVGTFLDSEAAVGEARRRKLLDLASTVGVLAWAWLIVIGGLMITPGGVSCPRCGPVLTRVLGVVSIVLGVLGLLSRVQSTAAQQQRNASRGRLST